ncbi:MAG: CRTAC1 family protein, partial [Planctomycetota bacterium]
PQSGPSRLLENRNGRLVDATASAAPSLTDAGLVTGAVWSDANGDGWLDLLITAEWGPIRFLENQQGRLVDRTEQSGLAERTGWYNGVAARDLDGDGDIDYVATNFGLNTKYRAAPDSPVVLFYGDFEGDGRKCLVEAEYEQGDLYPIRGRSCSTNAIPSLGRKFESFRDFAAATLPEIYDHNRLRQSKQLQCRSLESTALINDGKGKFQFEPLPRMAQISPAFGVLLTEFDGDGRADLFLAQNFFQPQPETGRMDGGMGLLLTGEGDGHFQPQSPAMSGVIVAGDATAVAECDLNGDGYPDLLVAQNDDELKLFRRSADDGVSRNPPPSLLRVSLRGPAGNPIGCGARVSVQLLDGRTQTAEVSAGGGYLSQSSPTLTFGRPHDSPVEQIDVRWPQGEESSRRATTSVGPAIEILHPSLGG